MLPAPTGAAAPLAEPDWFALSPFEFEFVLVVSLVGAVAAYFLDLKTLSFSKCTPLGPNCNTSYFGVNH